VGIDKMLRLLNVRGIEEASDDDISTSFKRLKRIVLARASNELTLAKKNQSTFVYVEKAP
jgi:hypothetical protein